MKLGTELLRRSEKEAFGKLLGLEAVEVSPGRAVVRMHAGPILGTFLAGFMEAHCSP